MSRSRKTDTVPRRGISRIPVRAIAVRFFPFALVGLSGVVVNAGLLYVLVQFLAFDYRIASIVAIEVSILNNFIWNYQWTWRDRRSPDLSKTAAMFVRFNVSSGLVALVVNWGILILLREAFLWNVHLCNLIGIGFGTSANFIASHFWAFGKRKDG